MVLKVNPAHVEQKEVVVLANCCSPAPGANQSDRNTLWWVGLRTSRSFYFTVHQHVCVFLHVGMLNVERLMVT